jgi:hypothetical protein
MVLLQQTTQLISVKLPQAMGLSGKQRLEIRKEVSK